MQLGASLVTMLWRWVCMGCSRQGSLGVLLAQALGSICYGPGKGQGTVRTQGTIGTKGLAKHSWWSSLGSFLGRRSVSPSVVNRSGTWRVQNTCRPAQTCRPLPGCRGHNNAGLCGEKVPLWDGSLERMYTSKLARMKLSCSLQLLLGARV